MAFTKLTKDMNIIQKLDDEPNDVGGLTAAELKAKFDEGTNAVKDWINNTFIPEAEETLRLAQRESVPAHAIRHGSGGADPITPALIGALNKAGDTMTGNLNFQMADNGSAQIYKAHNASVDYGFTVKDVDKAGNIARLLVQANNQKAFFVDKNDSYYTILHEGNKPYGSYTGNGSAASRTINTGGISGTVIVWTSSYIAFVVPGGAVIFTISSGAVTGLAYSEAKCNAGVITLATTNAGLNANGVTYYYQVL